MSADQSDVQAALDALRADLSEIDRACFWQTRNVWHGRQTRFLGSIAPDAGTDSRVIRFVFATSDICRDCDRMMHGAWDLENLKRNPIFGFNHDMSKPPIGKVIEIAERNGKLTAPCASLTPVCEPILAIYHDGTMNAVSVARRLLSGNGRRNLVAFRIWPPRNVAAKSASDPQLAYYKDLRYR